MGALTFMRSGQTEKVPASLEEKLVWLTKFGRPNLFHVGSGFNATIEMHVSAKGATFKVASDFKHEAPTAAVDELIGRMLETLAQLGSQ